MKTREGHVSNSSTSSFLLISTTTAYEKTMKEVSKQVANVASQVKKKFKNRSFGKEKLIIMNWISTDGEGWPLDQVDTETTMVRGCEHDVPEDAKFCAKCGMERLLEEEVDAYELWDEFVEKLSEKKDAYVEES